MKQKLLIIFVKNLKLGNVKTRLAKTIGDNGAFEIYKELVALTEKTTAAVACDKMIYFSDTIDDTRWQNTKKEIQFGVDLGAKMLNAFDDGFNLGYNSVIIIGSDLPDISSEIIRNGFNELEKSDIVFGPAQDGGYYLIGMNKLYSKVFKNKPWSQPNLLKVTLAELKQNTIDFSLLETLNDIDNYEDLIASHFYKNNWNLQQKINQIHE